MNEYNTFEEAFIGLNQELIEKYQYNIESRIGTTLEICPILYKINDVSTYKFDNEKIGRLDYEYCDTYYNWMISGNTEIKELAEKYPNTSRFLEKPKSNLLPENFNTFYGPRINYQLENIINELKNNKNTRRAVISILDKEDTNLLALDETLEFPCTDSATFYIRNNKLNVHVHMRSQNVGQVIKLDMYLWGRFTTELANKLGYAPGSFTSSIVSAHLFTRDLDYLKELINTYNEK